MRDLDRFPENFRFFVLPCVWRRVERSIDLAMIVSPFPVQPSDPPAPIPTADKVESTVLAYWVGGASRRAGWHAVGMGKRELSGFLMVAQDNDGSALGP